MSADERNVLRRPCSGCPFSTKTPPGDLRGNDVTRFIGQAIGPFLLPCHKWADEEGWELDQRRPQCAGAAMYRDRIGVAGSLPTALTRLPYREGDVFPDAAAYLAHHRGCTAEEAAQELREHPPEEHLRAELAHIGLRIPR